MDKLSIDIERTYNGRYLVTLIENSGGLSNLLNKKKDNKQLSFNSFIELSGWLKKRLET